jgi:hypothetical protein
MAINRASTEGTMTLRKQDMTLSSNLTGSQEFGRGEGVKRDSPRGYDLTTHQESK